MLKAKKILEISLQHDNEIKDAIKFNEENNYEYILVDHNDLIEYHNLAYLLRIGYTMQQYADTLTLVHKNYNKDIENVEL